MAGPDRGAFVRRLLPVAQKYAARTRIPAEVFLGIAAHESNFGNAGGNMLFGIKGPGKTHRTHEIVGGRRVDVDDSFRTYDSPEAAFDGFVGLVSSGRYAPSWNRLQETGDWQGFLQGINRAGYATDPQWARKVSSFTQSTIRPLMGGPTQEGPVTPTTKKVTTTTKTTSGTGSTGNAAAWSKLRDRYRAELDTAESALAQAEADSSQMDDFEKQRAAKARLPGLRSKAVAARSQLARAESSLAGAGKDGGDKTETTTTETEGGESNKLQHVTDKDGRVWAFDPLTGKATDIGLGSRGSQERTPEELDDSARGWAGIANQREQMAISWLREAINAGTLDFNQSTDFLNRLEKQPQTVVVNGKRYLGGWEPGGATEQFMSRNRLGGFKPVEYNAVDYAGAIGRPDLNQHLLSGPHKDALDAAGVPTGQAAAGMAPRSPLNDMVRQRQQEAAQQGPAEEAMPEPEPEPVRGLQPAPEPQAPMLGYDPLTKTMQPPRPPALPDPESTSAAMAPPPESAMPTIAQGTPADIAANSPERGPMGAPIAGPPPMLGARMTAPSPMLGGPLLGAPVPMDPEMERLLAQGLSPDEAFRKIAGWR